jgi:hypothetical protein
VKHTNATFPKKFFYHQRLITKRFDGVPILSAIFFFLNPTAPGAQIVHARKQNQKSDVKLQSVVQIAAEWTESAIKQPVE